MASNKKIIISMSIIGLLLVSLAISYAYFSAKITNNESESTIVATAAYLELTFIDGSPEINASNILPGWSACKTFSVQNTGDSTAYYVLKITDINNPFVYGGISYKIESNNGGANVALDTLPLANMPVTGPIEIQVNTTHNYTITTYYNELEENQLSDLGKSFSYTVSIEAVYKKEIQYIEDLVDLSNEVNNGDKYEHTWFVLTRNLDFNSDESYKNPTNTTTYGDYNGNGTVESIKTELTTGRGFIPIGKSSSIRFYGSLDGQNKRIDNIYIYDTDNSNTKRYALIGQAANTTVQNLTISGNITGIGPNNTGGIIGSIVNGWIINSDSSVVVNKTTSDNASGGILATAGGTVYVRNCNFSGSVVNAHYVGGLVGYLGKNSTLIIEKSHNSGAVTNNKGPQVGGLLGGIEPNSTTSNLLIYNSYNTGNIKTSISGTADTATGGLVGKSMGTITINNSYNAGEVTRDTITKGSSTNATIGGLIGSFEGSYVILKSYNTGAITGGNRTGGLIGQIFSSTIGIIDSCYNTGNLSSNYKDSSYDTAVAGIVGYPSNSTGKNIVINSYNIGSITSNQSAGGIFGRNNMASHIINSYNIGNISGTEYSSGILGALYGYSIKLNNVYNIGNISAGSKGKRNLFYRQTSSLTASVTNSYYLEGLSGSNVSGQTGTSLTAEYIASPEFVNLLNQNKRNINLSSIDASLATYELSDWKYDAEKGYPVLDN